MALKAELEQWHQAVEFFDEQDYTRSLGIFRTIADSAKIHFNIGLILSRKLDHAGAIESYGKALELDQYLVVAYFQRGVARMVQQNNAEALDDFNNALKYLRDNEFIDYTQIGLDYKVYTCEVMYNRALCFFCLRQEKDAQADLADASTRIVEDRHSLIKKAIVSNGMDCPLFCVPKGIIYRPSASKLKSTKKIDFLGSAKVIASADGKDNFTGFKGALVRKETLRNMGSGSGSGSGGPGGIGYQKSMRVRRTTPPPEMAPAGLARANTMPVNRHEPGSVPHRAIGPSSSLSQQLQGSRPQESSASMPPAAMRMRSAGNVSAGASDDRAHRHEYARDVDGESDNASTGESSAFSTPSPATTPGMADAMSPENGAGAPPQSAGSRQGAAPGGKKPAGKGGAVDPLDIIRAGLARRTTLKNQQQQQQRQRLNLPQRSATMKQMGSHDNGPSDGEAEGSQSRLAGQLRSNLGGLRGQAPAPAQVTRTEIAAPVVQRPDPHSQQTSPSEYPSPDYYSPETPVQPSSSVHPAMMTPPLMHEELAARGMANMNINQQGYPQHHPQAGGYAGSSSLSVSPSPGSPGPGSGAYGSLNGSAAALRRAPTKKDAMKVKVHFQNDIFNLMLPKLTTFDKLMASISNKLKNATRGQASGSLRIQYMDEDGEAVLMTDDDDFELAKAYAGGDMTAPETNIVDRLELWCSI
ncbi:hypothetical protein GGF46_001837 [Coemansia sp. RSA 552]|nr:hypothetical protein GGF46_001837 [Coemansia sp. RSA 552]